MFHEEKDTLNLLGQYSQKKNQLKHIQKKKNQ